ncbi:predicted protein [Histoplasma capsulatum G186AR]|uniref:Uncharacterized protein n=1 Tax=Ajellomyces capsulatus (strain G186AR / H82 / ATCC MYA-2454 / RMSCC 2432) TaxID=447093 RepID=C0NPW0_AJECG|nr:uncharacterized protein HCBG_05190 [Histoplasma capsulatum G186AR]EEH06970.1 predicted protein [Histoplasma capsulatum G186AR]
MNLQKCTAVCYRGVLTYLKTKIMEILTLSQVLEKLSPSTVLDSESLLRDFRQFLLRGTPEQCLELIPLQYRPSNNANISISQSPIHPSLTPPPQGPSLERLIPQLPSIVSVQCSTEPLPRTSSSCNSYNHPVGTETTYPPSASNLDCHPVVIKNGQYALQSRVSKKRQSAEANIDKGQGRELTAAWTEEPFIKLKKNFNNVSLSITSCEKIWGSTDSLLDMSLPTPGLRLNKLLKGSEARTADAIFANRLSLLFMTHEVDHKTWSIKHPNGAKRKTRAFNLVAADQKCSAGEIKVYDRRGRGYIKLMEEVGPMIVFELGKEVSNLCEYHLNDEQRQLFTNWLRRKDFNKGRAKKCISSAKLILDGITTYGKASYTYANLREAPSSLLDIVREYVSWDDDGTIHPKNHISTNNPSQQTSSNTGTPNQIENRCGTSPTYCCPSGSGAHECHNASFSKQVCSRQLSPIGELSFEEREAARMLQQFQQQLPQQPINNKPSGSHHSAYDPAYYPMQSEPTLVGALRQQSVNPSVEGDIYPNPCYRQSVNPSVEGDIYPNPGYGQSVNPSVEGDIYPNPGYGQSVNPSVEGDIYSNPGYGQSVNPINLMDSWWKIRVL